jgi:DNA-binding beta-propeller fold protein YncE
MGLEPWDWTLPAPDGPDSPPGEPDALSGERLVVADTDAEHLYVVDVGTWQVIADFPDIKMADHPGFLPLADGRLLFIDSNENSLKIMRVTGAQPQIERSVPVLGSAAHIAIDPSGQHAVVSASAAYEDGRGALTLASLENDTFTHTPISTGEPGLAVVADPLRVVHRSDGPPQFELYLYDALLQGEAEPLDVVGLGAAPHGEVVAHARGKLVSAAADGINIVSYTDEGLGDVSVVPYSVGDADYGRAFYARQSGDGRFLYSYLRDDAGGELPWEQWRNDAYIVDLETQTAKRIPVGNGLVYRLGVCESLAALTQYAPDGDYTYLMDADTDSPTFQTFTAKVPLERMSLAPEAGGDVWGSEAFRITALSSDCKYAFVTHGGDAKISVIDTAAAEVVRTLELPTRLAYGGYMVSMRNGQRIVDTIGR